MPYEWDRTSLMPHLYSEVEVSQSECDASVPEDVLGELGNYDDHWYSEFSSSMWYTGHHGVGTDEVQRAFSTSRPLKSQSARGHFRLRKSVMSPESRRCLSESPGLRCMADRFELNIDDSPATWVMEAEGTIDAEKHRLCLVVCRSVSPLLAAMQNATGLEGVASKDCQMSLTLVVSGSHTWGEFEAVGVGTFRSLRNASDPLFFEPMEFRETGRSAMRDAGAMAAIVWSENAEALQSLVAMSLSIFCVWAQLRHSHREPKFVPHLSRTMLWTLAAGYAIPLMFQLQVVDFLYRPGRRDDNYIRSNDEYGGSLEASLEAVLRVLAMVPLVLLLRLISNVSSAQKLRTQRETVWKEAAVPLISALLYLITAIVAWPLMAFMGRVSAAIGGAGIDPPQTSACTPQAHPCSLVYYGSPR